MRSLFLLAGLALVALSSDLQAQQSVVADSGASMQILGQPLGGGHGNGNGRTGGSLTTTFLSNNNFAGNMVDLEPNVDFEIDAIDVNTRSLAPEMIEVWYRNGTSFGNETNPLGDWVLIGTYSCTGMGQDNATNVNMTGNGVTFLAGGTYGFFVYMANYINGTNNIHYTNGAVTYSNADLDLITNCGKGDPGFAGSTFTPRQWNGTLYYCVGGGGTPRLTVTNLVAGSTATATVRNATPSGLVGIGYSLTGAGPTTANAGPCGSVTVDLSNPITVLPLLTADAAGVATAAASIPAGTTGISIWVHALDLGSCTLSNSLAEIIG